MLTITGILTFMLHIERGALTDYKDRQSEETSKLVSKMNKLVHENNVLSQENTLELLELRKTYEASVNDLITEHTNRVRNLEKRSDYYRSMSQAGSVECGDLGDIATRLDRSLEEGRQLVVELRSRLGLREEQIRLIGKQLKADRHLLEQDN